MKSLILCAALACGITFASEAKTAVKPALAPVKTAQSDLLTSNIKKALLPLDELHVIEVDVCGHYGWVAYYNTAQLAERMDYLMSQYC